MMHRVSKKNDINQGKWIGVGGKFEKGETPEACMRREVREETGLLVDAYRYCGIVTFVSDDDETEYMHLFTVTAFHAPGGAVYDNEAHGSGSDAPDAGSIVHGSGSDVRDSGSKAHSSRSDVRDSGSKAHGSGSDVRDSGSDDHVPDFAVQLKKCDEGQLEWLPKEKLTHIPHWAGDRIFLPLILDMEIPFFSMKLVYRKGELVHASMNEHNCLVTERLILRPWLAEDASVLYHHAKNPKIGPRAGWLPLTGVEQSRSVLREILFRPEIYAIVLRDTAEPIGSVGLQNFRLVDEDGACLTFFDERRSENPLVCTMPGIWEEDITGASTCADEKKGQEMLPGGCRVEAALGYWLAEPYWHQGIMTEAAGAVLAHARRDLGIRRVWADYYEGNEASANVMKRLGFHFHHIEEDRYIEPLDERRTAIVQAADLTDAELNPYEAADQITG